MKKLVVAMLAGTMLLSSGLQVSAAGLKDVFDAEYYANSYKDLKDAFGTDEEALYKHFLEYGLKEGRVMNPIIDVAAYRGKYEDLDKAFGDNWDAYIDHYFTYGVKENRDNGTDFDLKKYMAAYEDLREEFGEEDSFLFAKHFIEFGQDENRVKGNKSYEEPKPAASQGAVTAPHPGAIHEYDENGYIIKSTIYYEDGTFSCIKEYTRDENGLPITEKAYDESGVLWSVVYTWGDDGELDSEKIVYSDGDSELKVYDDDGVLNYTEYYGADGSYISKVVERYDENGVKVGIISYFADGSYWVSDLVDAKNNSYVTVKMVNADGSYTTSEWNDMGAISKHSTYDTQGNLVSYLEYKYDANGNMSEDIWYDADGTLILRAVLTLDANGKTLYTTYHNPDGSYYISQGDDSYQSFKYFDADGNFDYWEKTYYDENGDGVSRVEYDENGNVVKEYIPEITEEGNIHWVEK